MKAKRNKPVAKKKITRTPAVKARKKASKKALRARPARRPAQVAKKTTAEPEAPIAIYEVVETRVYEEPAIVIAEEEEFGG